MFGWMGKILLVNLTTGKVKEEKLDLPSVYFRPRTGSREPSTVGKRFRGENSPDDFWSKIRPAMDAPLDAVAKPKLTCPDLPERVKALNTKPSMPWDPTAWWTIWRPSPRPTISATRWEWVRLPWEPPLPVPWNWWIAAICLKRRLEDR